MTVKYSGREEKGFSLFFYDIVKGNHIYIVAKQ